MICSLNQWTGFYVREHGSLMLWEWIAVCDEALWWWDTGSQPKEFRKKLSETFCKICIKSSALETCFSKVAGLKLHYKLLCESCKCFEKSCCVEPLWALLMINFRHVSRPFSSNFKTTYNLQIIIVKNLVY